MYLTKKQKDIFNYIKDYIDDKEYSPSLKEIGEYFDNMSTSGVFYHLKALEKKGVIKKRVFDTRSIEIVETLDETARGAGGFGSTGRN